MYHMLVTLGLFCLALSIVLFEICNFTFLLKNKTYCATSVINCISDEFSWFQLDPVKPESGFTFNLAAALVFSFFLLQICFYRT